MRIKDLSFLVALFLTVSMAMASDAQREIDNGKLHFKDVVTMRDFVVLAIFPEWDSVIRVDVGNKNLFGAEASKDYPNFVVLFQKVAASEVKRPLRTNVTVLMKSGHVFHFLIKSSDNEKTPPDRIPLVYDFTKVYADASGVKTVALDKPNPGPSETEKAVLEKLSQLEEKFEKVAEAKAKEKLFDWVAADTGPVIRKESEGSLEAAIREIRKVDGLSLVGFSVTNRGSSPVEILEPWITLETVKGKKTLRSRTMPMERLRLSSTKVAAKGSVQGVVVFKSDFERDASQVFRLLVASKAAVDKPVKVTIF